MKEFKTAIIEAIVAAAETDRIISLYETGRELGHKHISSQDCRDIMSAVLKRLPGYKAVKLTSPNQTDAAASLWTTLNFIEKGIEFEDCGEEDIAPPATIKEICEAYGLSQTQLSQRFDIPLRTIQDWYADRRTTPSYVISMMRELLSR